MAVVVCFEGHLDSQPTRINGTEACEVVAISKRYRGHSPTANTTGTRYQLRAEDDMAPVLATVPHGTNVVVIGHVHTIKQTDPTDAISYSNTVVIDSLGIVPTR